jgi:hypothetical protein
MGGRKTLMSGRVTSSGNIPPVCSYRVRRRSVSSTPKRAAMPGRCQTGSIAALVVTTAPSAELRGVTMRGMSVGGAWEGRVGRGR